MSQFTTREPKKSLTGLLAARTFSVDGLHGSGGEEQQMSVVIAPMMSWRRPVFSAWFRTGSHVKPG